MRSPTLLWPLVAAALLGSGPAGSQPAQPSSTNYTVEEQEGDDGKPVGRRMNPDDADLGVENTDNVPKVAQVEDDDPFFMSDDSGKKLPPLPPGKDIVTCMAGFVFTRTNLIGFGWRFWNRIRANTCRNHIRSRASWWWLKFAEVTNFLQ